MRCRCRCFNTTAEPQRLDRVEFHGREYPPRTTRSKERRMFEKALAEIREGIFAILSSSPPPPNAITPSVGTAFMVAPACSSPPPAACATSRDPVILPRGIAGDPGPRDRPGAGAGIRRDRERQDGPGAPPDRRSRSAACLRLLDATVPVGTHCGTAGSRRSMSTIRPLSALSLIELFQGADISSSATSTGTNGYTDCRYETDSRCTATPREARDSWRRRGVSACSIFPPGSHPSGCRSGSPRRRSSRS
jgi:hypothetical protein